MEVENREEYSIVDECKKTLCTRYIKHLVGSRRILAL